MLAVGDRGGGLVLWDAALLEPVRTMVGHDGTVVAVSFSPDGRRLVSCSDQDQVFIWDAATGERLRERSGSGKSEIARSSSPIISAREAQSWYMTWLRLPARSCASASNP